MDRGVFASDANNLTTPGIYRTMTGAVNVPSDNGFLLVFGVKDGGNTIMQVGCAYDGSVLKLRTSWYDNWRNWRSITTV